MKRLNLFLGAAALVAVSLTASPALNAQENGNRDENGKIVRGPYETNRFGDNSFEPSLHCLYSATYTALNTATIRFL